MAAVFGAPAFGQATVAVEPDDPILARIDRLASEGAVRTAIVGQRPHSRREVARLLAEARGFADSLAAMDPARAARIRALLDLDAWRYEGAIAASTRLVSRVSVDAALGSPGARVIPYGGTGPLGRIDAVLAPLTERRNGRHYNDGVTVGAESSHRVQLGRHAAFALGLRAWTGAGVTGEKAAREPGADTTPPLNDISRARPISGTAVRTAALTLGARNVRVTVGRDFQLLGQSMHGGGLMLSDNAPALDMIALASDAPFRLPWIFRRMGAAQASGYLADLGDDRDFPGAKLAGWKLSFLPSPRVEWGVSVQSEQGGRGAPGASVAERVLDLAPLIDVLLLQDSDLLFSNKLAGLDLRVRVPQARGLELYVEGAADDWDIRRIRSSFTEDAAWVAGFAVTQLSAPAKLRLDVEARHTGLRFYQHEQFTSGLTLNRFVLGDPIGPRAKGLAARVSRDFGGRAPLLLTLALESRSNDRWEVTVEDATAAGFTFHKREDRPEEIRRRAVLAWNPAFGAGALRAVVEAGWESVSNANFRAGDGDRNGMLRIGLDARF